MLISLENIIEFPGYYIDDQSYEIWSFKQYKEGKKIKLSGNSREYCKFEAYHEGKRKHILFHHIIVKLFIDPNYNPKTQQIDHLDHNKLNNSIDNLKVVSKSENEMNKTSYGGRQAVYLDDIGESIVVNEEHGIYYSKTFDKFYRFVEHTRKYRQISECKNGVCMQIGYRYNKKIYHVNCTRFREQLSFS